MFSGNTHNQFVLAVAITVFVQQSVIGGIAILEMFVHVIL